MRKIYVTATVFMAFSLSFIISGNVSAKFFVPKKCGLKEGEKKRLVSAKKAKKCKFTSGKPSVAGIKKNGVIVAKKAGVCKIKIKYKKKRYTCKVTVSEKNKKGLLTGGASYSNLSGTITSIEDKSDCRIIKVKIQDGNATPQNRMAAFIGREITVTLRGNVYRKDAVSGTKDTSVNVAGRMQIGDVFYTDAFFYLSTTGNKILTEYEFDEKGVCRKSASQGRCYLVY